jgi:hypothetical protein
MTEVVKNPAENHLTATVFGMPDWAATGTTEAEALRKVESLLDEKLANGKIVTIEVPEMKHEREIKDLI